MTPFLVTPPSGDILTDADLRRHVQVDDDYNGSSDDMAQLRDFERAAVSYLDGYTGRLGRCLLTQTWAIELGSTDRCLRLPFPETRDHVFKVKDAGGSWNAMPDGAVAVDGLDVVVCSFPDGVSKAWLHFTAGSDSPDEVDARAKQILRLLVAVWDEDRIGLEGLPPMIEDLIGSYRVIMG